MSTASPCYALGIDFGTNSVRALLVDVSDGRELAVAVCDYYSGVQGVVLDEREPHLARQVPADYTLGFVECVRAVVQLARQQASFSPDRIVGIGVDTTGSTPLPVDDAGVPLAARSEFANEPAALAWLWKDHTSHAEAAEISERARTGGWPYLSKCGGEYSSEWYWSKALHCERHHPRVAQAAYSWVELCDWLPAWLTGNLDPRRMARGICAAGHKAMYHPAWNGLPAAEFLNALAPGFARFRERYAPRAQPASVPAGRLREDLAAQVGLPAGIPVATGALDAHLGAVGAGVAPGTLVKIIGTSTCDCLVAPLDEELPDIPGVCGIVPESILPGAYGIEAGQSAVGDIFNWFVERIAPGGGDPTDLHARLNAAAAELRPGASGLLALDWHNGNRTVLVDPRLTGLIVGETLATTPAEIYRALIEATAFGALRIMERLEEYGVPIERVVNCGGIAEKSPLVMQIYADVCSRPMLVSRSVQSCALGAAIYGAVVGGAHADVPAAQRAMTGVRSESYEPDPDRVAVYRRLNKLYRTLHDAFGTSASAGSLYEVMKELLRIREQARSPA